MHNCLNMEENNIPTGTDRQSCILQCGSLCNEATDSIKSTQRWENIKQKALLWSGLDKFGHVYETVDWDKGPVGKCVHEACMLTLCNSKKLEQAKKRQKQQETDECPSQSSVLNDCSTAADPPAK